MLLLHPDATNCVALAHSPPDQRNCQWLLWPPAHHAACLPCYALQEGGGTSFGQCVLFFGCRRSDQDYLYGPLLKGWAAQGQLTLFTAFSRQQVRGRGVLH